MSDEPRDPTLEELYTGPVRALPDEIQEMAVEDTACTFCGVSYFVFAEVQTLQKTLKQYKKTFRVRECLCFLSMKKCNWWLIVGIDEQDFVRFMERERSEARVLRQQTTELKDTVDMLVTACSASTMQLAKENDVHRSEAQRALDQLQKIQKALLVSEQDSRALQLLSKRNEEELKLAHSLVEQKLRNEILHLSSQVESSKLMSASQETSFKEQNEQAQQRIQELETKLIEGQTHWTAAERQMVIERDVLKQERLERVELETNTARQLEEQLSAIREELARVVAASETERKSSSNVNSEVIQLKHQLQTLEKSRAPLLSENGRFKDDKYKYEDEIKALRLRVDTLQGQLSMSTSSTERVKGDYVRDLETLRGEHGAEISRLQRDHERAIEELKTSQKTYLEYLKKETAELQTRGEQSSQQALLAIDEKFRDAERRANEWKDRAQQNASEREEAKRNCIDFQSRLQALQARLDSSERDMQKIVGEAESSRVAWEKKLANALQETGRSRDEVEQRRKQLQDENAGLKKQLHTIQAQVDNERKQLAKASQAQVARQSKQTGDKKPPREESSNQASHDTEMVIDQLRQTLKQKDREIALLQQTVHRECMERTSLLERMRGVKVVPEIGVTAVPALLEQNDRVRALTSTSSYTSESSEYEQRAADVHQPQASFYEKLRRAGSRKAKPRR